MGGPAQLDRFIYVDDSGHPQSGQVVYGWLSCEPHHWADVLGAWLELRRRLWACFGIPPTKELHATDYIHGRGRIATAPPSKYVHDGVIHWKDLGQDVAVESLRAIGSMEGVRVGAVKAQGTAAALAATRRQLYAHLVATFEKELAARNALALIFVDGDGSDPTYRDVHRDLPRGGRHIIEDPIHQDSAVSQMLQMADLVAWTANAHATPHRRAAFAQAWWEEYLSIRDVDRQPRVVAL